MAQQTPGKCFRCGSPIDKGYTLCQRCAAKLHENEKEQAKTDICDNYCKYPNIWDEEVMGMELCSSEICARCPLNRL